MQAGVAESTETLLQSADGQDAAKLTNSFKYGVCVWACGNAPRPICRSLIETHQTLEPGISYTGERLGGRILIDPWLRMIGNQDGSVFALGDCAENEEGPLPQTAQVAAQQGAFVAHLLNDEVGRVMSEADAQAYQYGGRVQDAIEEGVRAGDAVALALQQSDRRLARPFEFLSLGILAYVGNRKALAQVLLFPATSGSLMLALMAARSLSPPHVPTLPPTRSAFCLGTPCLSSFAAAAALTNESRAGRGSIAEKRRPTAGIQPARSCGVDPVALGLPYQAGSIP